MVNADLGIDVGSVSVKAVISDKGKIIDKVYFKNYGLINTIKKIFTKLTPVDIKSVCITGSGKEFVNFLIGGDITESEIICHALAAMEFMPDIRTLFDIGGEDSKCTLIRDNVIISSQLNKSCGGGTGAMIEAIADRLNVKVEDVGGLALKSKTRFDLSSKCGLFNQSEAVEMNNQGVPKEDILMGVCRAFITIYFNTVAKGILSPPYVFQGAPAKNKALIRCFEEELNEKIYIPPDCEYMGAKGAAIIASEQKIKKTNFKGFNIIDSDFQTRTFICRSDKNCKNCKVTEIIQDNEIIGYLGSKCGKYTNKETLGKD